MSCALLVFDALTNHTVNREVGCFLLPPLGAYVILYCFIIL